MGKLFIAPSVLAAVLAAGLAASPSQASADDDCGGLIGTYLSKNTVENGASRRLASRSLISFTGSGQIFFTDSGEGGEVGYAPFTGGRGAWRCLGTGQARAIVLDFTLAHGDRKAQIGRLDMDFSYDSTTKTISGTGVLHFVPLQADPMQSSELKEAHDFKVTGQRVEAP